jgi:hypothetical protein
VGDRERRADDGGQPPRAVTEVRPRAIPAAEAGQAGIGGWIAPAGAFYPASKYQHIRIALELRRAGGGPTEPWDMRDGWVMVRSTGEALALPDRVSQPQLDTLADMLIAAPVGPYRSELLTSLRRLQELEICPSLPRREGTSAGERTQAG